MSRRHVAKQRRLPAHDRHLRGERPPGAVAGQTHKLFGVFSDPSRPETLWAVVSPVAEPAADRPHHVMRGLVFVRVSR